MKRTKIIAAVCTVLVIVLLVCILPFPQRINKTYSGVKWYNSSAVSLNTELGINGWYFRYLFRENKFNGSLTYDNRELEVNSLYLFDSAEIPGKAGTIIFYNPDTNQMEQAGPIYISGSFDEVLICDDSGFISFPANNRDDAVDVAIRLTDNMYT